MQKKIKTIINIFLLVSTFFIILNIQSENIQGYYTLELSSFTQVGARYSMNETRITGNVYYYNDGGKYVYKTYPSNYFYKNYNFSWNSKMTGWNDVPLVGGVLMLANTSGDLKGLALTSAFYGVYFYRSDGIPYNFYIVLRGDNSTITYQIPATVTNYYFVFNKNQTNNGKSDISLYIYSDYYHTTLLTIMNLTVNDYFFNTLQIGYNYDGGAGGVDRSISYYSENYILKTGNLELATESESDVSPTTATLNGYLLGMNDSMVTTRFEYGTTIAYGTNTTNQTVTTNGTAFSQSVTGLNVGKLYHYRAFVNNSHGEIKVGDNEYFLTKPNASSNSNITYRNTSFLNITWTKGDGANRTVISYKQFSQPTSITDGTIIYNDTGTATDFDFAGKISNFFTFWSYTNWTTNSTSLFQYSYAYNGSESGQGLLINCYEEDTYNNLTFNVSISNLSGSEVYNAWYCTNTKAINSTLCPQGLVSILISSENHSSRIYYLTIEKDVLYILMTYLPKNISNLYLITVVNELGYSLSNVELSIKKYSNLTGFYETISTTYTDGAGQTSLWLLSGQQYKIFLNKTGYTQSGSNDWIPDAEILTKTFKMISDQAPPQPPILEDIHFTYELITNTTIFLTYEDDSLRTEYTVLTVMMYNYNTSIWTLIGVNTNNTNYWVENYNGLNRSNIYYFNLTFYHTDLGLNHRTIVIDRIILVPLTESKISDRFSWLGYIPIGVSNLLMWFLLIGIMFNADERDVGKIIMILGILFIIINSFIGMSNGITLAFGGGLPVLFILIGILIEWGNARKKEIG